MISRKVLRGQCASCVNGPSCTYLDGHHSRVFQCNEFEAYTKAEVSRPEVNPTVDTEDCPAAGSALLNGRRGLCSTCGRWEQCSFPYAEGGVWHCEEYR